MFPNGTKYSVTLYTDTNKAWDPSLELGVATYLTNLGINVQTQTLTSANLGADYASNAFNIQNNLVVYSSGGAQYFSPWVSAQQDCNVYGTPGCFNWFAQNAPDGLPHEEWPPYADAWYQSNLTAINNTPATNITGQIHYLGKIQAIRAEYLPVIMLGYPEKIFAYNTAKWTGWPTYYASNEGQVNETMFDLLQLAGSSSTSTSTSSTLPSTTATSASASSSQTGSASATSTGTSASASTSSATSTANSVTSATTLSSQSSTTTGNSNSGTTELIAAVVVIIIIIGGIGAYMLRRKPPAAGT